MSLSGLQFRMRQRIISKIEKAGATSREKAVTIEEAGLDMQEQKWLTYFAGVFLGKVKKTKDKRYYISRLQ
ncbi:hypothetical protein GWO13_00720 [Candidatus Bathyarchaeota archaeon]|nr:hypothetical protein [Candidatus Bathyarchaeota archaeon]